MNEINQETQVPMQEKVSVMPEHHHKYWALVLVLMGLTLAAAMYLVYKNSTARYMPNTQSTIQQTNEVQPEEPNQTSGSVELDQKMTTPNVTDDVLDEIDDVEKNDPANNFDQSQINDLQ
jgi:hypothetical protein